MTSRFLEENDKRGWDLKAILITKGEEIIAKNFRADEKELLPQYSITKCFTSACIGALWDQGRIDLDGYISDYIEEIDNFPDDSRLRRVKVKHLLMNAMGNAVGYLFETDRHTHGTDDYLSLILSKPLEYEPGEKFVYGNANFYLLSRIIENISGVPADDYLARTILHPMGIIDYRITKCPMGHFLGGSGIFMRTADVAKMGIMYSNYGMYKGLRLLSREYIEQAFLPQIKLNSKERYGYAFMMKDSRCVFVPGNYNQLLLIDKNANISVTVNSNVCPSDTGTLMKLVRRVIINGEE